MVRELLNVVLPCYNEAENISGLVRAWSTLESQLNEKNIETKIIIIDDGSESATRVVLDLLKREYDNVTVLHHRKNMGLGVAINTGINYVLNENNRGLLCIMDADMTHSPEYVISMIDRLRNNNEDCVIASRYMRGSRVEGLSIFRKVLSLGARALYTVRFRIAGAGAGARNLIRDYTCGYRLYRVDMLRQLAYKYDDNIITEQGFASMVELLIKIGKSHFKIGEVPFTLRYQLKKGQSKMNVMKTINRSLYLVMRF